jgi:hypothetical protein
VHPAVKHSNAACGGGGGRCGSYTSEWLVLPSDASPTGQAQRPRDGASLGGISALSERAGRGGSGQRGHAEGDLGQLVARHGQERLEVHL